MSLLSTYLSLLASSGWLWLVVLVIVLYWLYMRKVAFYDTSAVRTDDKTFLITGAETGIGRMCADLLAARGGRIIMACKDVALGQAAKAQIVARTLNERVEVHYLDLSSLACVRQFSKNIHDSVDRLDVLINNAGTASAPSSTTADGLNTVMQVNHFGPFLLTNLLLDLLKKSTPSRIVFISSISHHFHKLSLDNLNCEREPLPGCRVYFNSKLANILTTKYLARILQGTGVTVNSVHPGIAQTNLTTNSCSVSIIGLLCKLWMAVFAKNSREAAMTPAFVASDPTLLNVTGHHFAECKISGCVARITKDTILQEKLFEKSAQLVNLRPEEQHI